jgi:vacuolar-type H+-ATPase subunit E/Vma4
VLAARGRMLDRIRARLDGELASLLDDRLAAAVVGAALACAGDDPGVLRCAPAVLAVARARAPATIEVLADAAVATGAVLELATGTRVDATLAALVEREWPALACEALALERAR